MLFPDPEERRADGATSASGGVHLGAAQRTSGSPKIDHRASTRRWLSQDRVGADHAETRHVMASRVAGPERRSGMWPRSGEGLSADSGFLS